MSVRSSNIIEASCCRLKAQKHNSKFSHEESNYMAVENKKQVIKKVQYESSEWKIPDNWRMLR
jgi:hypothetical protein